MDTHFAYHSTSLLTKKYEKQQQSRCGSKNCYPRSPGMDIWCIQEFFYINLPILRRWNHRAQQFFNYQWNHAGVKTVDVFCFFGWWENPSPQRYAEKNRVEVGETREFFSYTKLIPFQLCYIYNELLRQSYRVSHHITPRKINMEPENEGFNRNLLFQGFIFRFHVNFRGCNDLDNFMGNQATRIFFGEPAIINPTVHLDSRWTRLVASITPISRSSGVESFSRVAGCCWVVFWDDTMIRSPSFKDELA